MKYVWEGLVEDFVDLSVIFPDDWQVMIEGDVSYGWPDEGYTYSIDNITLIKESGRKQVILEEFIEVLLDTSLEDVKEFYKEQHDKYRAAEIENAYDPTDWREA